MTCVSFFEEGFSKAYETQRGTVEKMGVNIFPYHKLKGYFKEDLPKEDVVIDALFGTGFSGDLAGEIAECILKVNDVRGPLKMAVDIPSGLNGNTGRGSLYFQSDVTVTFAYPKWGHLLSDEMGEVYLGRISFDPDMIQGVEEAHKIYYYKINELKEFFIPRKKEGHKGLYGHLGILGGNHSMVGAPLMAGMAALHMGSGLVTAWIDEKGLENLLGRELELMLDDWNHVLEKDVEALLIGPGLGREFEVPDLQEKLSVFEGPVIIDADGFIS